MCVLSKCVHTKKKSGNLSYAPRISCYNCVPFSSLSQHLIFFCYFIFYCCHRLLFCVSNLIPHPGLAILLLFFRENPMFLQTSFAPAQIRLFSSVILFARIIVNKSLFLVSALTVFQSWFWREGTVVFLSEITLFIITTFLLLGLVLVLLCLRVWYFGCYFSVCLWLDVSGISVFSPRLL